MEAISSRVVLQLVQPHNNATYRLYLKLRKMKIVPILKNNSFIRITCKLSGLVRVIPVWIVSFFMIHTVLYASSSLSEPCRIKILQELKEIHKEIKAMQKQASQMRQVVNAIQGGRHLIPNKVVQAPNVVKAAIKGKDLDDGCADDGTDDLYSNYDQGESSPWESAGCGHE